MDGIQSPRSPRRLLVAALSAVLLGFALWCSTAALLENDPRFQDTEPFLGHALYVADHGGALATLRDAYRGEFPIVERHLLYPLLLAPFATRAAEFFRTAKLVNVGLGVITLTSLLWIARRRFGLRVAALATGLYACTGALLVASSHVAQENLFVLCVLWAFHFLTSRAPAVRRARTERSRGVDSVASSSSTSAPSAAVGQWACAGALLGLAWLTKSSAALLAAGLALAALVHFGPRIVLERRAWALVACGLLLASPLLVRNAIAFGTPVYEGMNGHIMWMDDWTELGSPASILYYDQYGITRIERNALPTATTYAAEHDFSDVATRLRNGMRLQLTRVIPAALGPPAPVPTTLRRLWGASVLALALVGAWRLRRRWLGRIAIAWSIAFVLFFAWNTLFPEPRYLAPLVPLWALLAATVVDSALRRLRSRSLRSALIATSLALVALLGAARAASAGALLSPPPLISASPAAWRLLRWIDADAQPGTRLMIGPTREFFGLLWLTAKPVQVVQTPRVDELTAFLRYLRERRVNYLVLHPENVHGEQGRLTAALSPYVSAVAGGVVELHALPEWRLVAADVGDPPRYLIYRASRVPTHAAPSTLALAAAEATR